MFPGADCAWCFKNVCRMKRNSIHDTTWSESLILAEVKLKPRYSKQWLQEGNAFFGDESNYPAYEVICCGNLIHIDYCS
jgi:hypothetical protein